MATTGIVVSSIGNVGVRTRANHSDMTRRVQIGNYLIRPTDYEWLSRKAETERRGAYRCASIRMDGVRVCVHISWLHDSNDMFSGFLISEHVTKSSIMREVAESEGLPCENHRVKRLRISDMRGFPITE